MRSFVSWSLLSAVFLLPYSLNANSLPKSCSNSCTSSFGNKLGENSGVVGYSNCTNDCESDKWTTITLGQHRYKTGMKWQCVEYARRWYMKRLGYSFASIDHAYEIWDLEHVDKLGSELKGKWKKLANGKTTEKPQLNDLLIYNKKQGIHGHVSVIVKVTDDYVYIAEQNYTNAKWDDPSYARKLALIHNTKGHYSLKDLGVIGWMRISD